MITRRKFLIHGRGGSHRDPFADIVDCGEDDPFADASRDFLRRVPGASGGVSSGFHESPTWRSFVPDQLDFLRSRL